MADQTPIEWTDATWNIITGCSVVSPGCTNCYAMKLAGTRLQHHPSRAGLTIDSKAGPVWNGQVRFNAEWLTQPLRWTKPRMIFVCAHGDLFHEGVPDEWLDQIFAVMALCPQHTFQVLTKRPERMRAYFAETWQVPAQPAMHVAGLDIPARPAHTEDRWSRINLTIDRIITGDKLFDQNRFWTVEGSLIGRPAWPRRPLPNVWLGVSVEDQTRADDRIPILLDTPAAVRWISAEPLLGPVGLRGLPGLPTDDECVRINALTGRWRASPRDEEGNAMPRIDWVVAGGESGSGARPMHPDWARQLRDQCAEAGVPFLFKQWGAWAATDRPTHWLSATGELRAVGNGVWASDAGIACLGKKAVGRHLDGQLHDGFPA
ncbi:phage Gp37/Gp68 family protein [Brevundimonas sp. A19_0]|uniref:DUF5131 family protein n=1 Tax=Brevundimonas sp. A19_0 TaxID=2821087 RepID=UPI001ADA0B2B|nr:phage Gp37/Gp68 family protein [Brevundimonas sp. A19_0]MBO9502050.1 phage Gp37/Gp68 family protein [Brevundimonas sp. A19_0]